ANAEVVCSTVAQPIEEQVNGVDDMLYMSSTCSSDGSYTLTVTFSLGVDLDIATVLVQNRVGIATAKLPEEVKRLGITTQKQSTNFVQMIVLTSQDPAHDDLYLSNYATMRIKDELSRIPGAGSVRVFGAGDYSMRIWLDPDRLEARDLTTNDVVNALREQNVQVAAGKIGAEPSPPGQQFEYTVNVMGRLAEVEEFENIIIKSAPGGAFLRVKDVARVELGTKSYGMVARVNNRPAAVIAIYQSPGANALQVAAEAAARMQALKKAFPQGVEYDVSLDSTLFITASIDEVVVTLFIAILLVFITIYIFLQDWRATLIPALTIPVSLVGAFLFMLMFDFSINLISLFGIVLAIGIVVDDAILVVENTDRNIQQLGLAPKQAAIRAMEEVGGPIVATTLVLLAVFVPTAFMGGITGQLYRQFALTIAGATVISSLNALTLSPALCAILLRKKEGEAGGFFALFNRGFDALTGGYMGVVRGFVRKAFFMLLVAAALGVGTFWVFGKIPSSFLPTEDQGYAFVSVQLPDAASLERTNDVARILSDRVGAIPGVRDVIAVTGYSLMDGAALSNAATLFVPFKPFDERLPQGHDLAFIMSGMRQAFADVQEARVVAFAPPPIPGLGNSSGFDMKIQDRAGVGPEMLQLVIDNMAADASAQSGIGMAYSIFRAGTPQLFADVDRVAAKTVGVPLNDIFSSMQAYLGSAYVNDFSKFGRNFQVNLQADGAARARVEDIERLKVRNDKGEMVPLGTFVDVDFRLGPQVLTRYNLYPAASINGEAAPGFSSGQALAIMEDMAGKVLPDTMGYEWTGMSYQEKLAGGTAIIFLLAIVFVYLVLAAQYESWTIPMGVIMVVPLALMGTVIAVLVRQMDVDTYTQIGIVLLVGLAAKNAIVIVEFAREQRDQGKSIFDAATEAARLRFRPILMTSLAFVFGTFPLVVATGAGAASRQTLGTAVFGGMIAATLMSVLFTPVFFAVIQTVSEKLSSRKPRQVPEEDETTATA
ncbi:MAG: multidrug efflux RND transporter permease subunit, partial [Pseudomonadota bacterium]|nr:multidrug efflux RND transporter permease subunit [Pseudomonadota bacterium]